MDPLTLSLIVAAGLLVVICLWLLIDRSRLVAQRDLARQRVNDGEEAKASFKSLAGDVLRDSNEEFLRLAKETLGAKQVEAVAEIDKRRQALDQLILPIREAVQRTHKELREVGKDHAGLREQVRRMIDGNRELRSETNQLVQALRKPNVRGRYGEIQLERVVELAGMRGYCDFSVQENVRDEGGRLQKPDMVVRLPNGRVIAIDAKTSVDAYLDSLNAQTPEAADASLDRYAENVMLQVQRLSRKAYWTRFDSSPEFVVMFIPGDQLVDAALERRPELIEYAAERNVVIASPATLIGLLRAVHVGWREKNLTDSAAELFELGRELHKRAANVLEHASRVGESIDGARRHYNNFVGSVQGRLVPALRKFEERDARSAKELTELRPIEGEARQLEGLLPLEEPDKVIVPPTRSDALEAEPE